MPTIGKRNDDPIDYLINRRFPLARHIAPMSLQHGSSTAVDRSAAKEAKAQADKYRQELSALPPTEVTRLVTEERRKEVDEIATRLLREEQERFFNKPSSAAPYDHYCKLAYWTLDECVALSLGKNPETVNWLSVKVYVQVSPFAKNYERLRTVVERAKWAKQLFDPVYPSNFLAWAKEIDFPICKDLLGRAVNAGISLTGWRDLYEKQKALTGEVERQYEEFANAATSQIESLRNELANLASGAPSLGGKPLGTRERESMLKLIIGLAYGGYGYVPNTKRTPTAAEISSDLAKLGLSLDQDTIRKFLREGGDLIDRELLSELMSKPNSPRR